VCVESFEPLLFSKRLLLRNIPEPVGMNAVIQLFGNDVDVSSWQDKHPGGRKLLKIFHNRDATQQFIAIHRGDTALNILKSLPKKPSLSCQKMESVEMEFNSLVEKLQPELSKTRPIYECMKVIYVLSFFIGGYILCFRGHTYIGLAMMCLSMYQAGWVGHDYSHRSVFSSPALNNLFADMLGVIQGYSDIWWKSRHNTHHMVTNEIGNDPDIRTEPVLHFFDKHCDHRSSSHIPAQHLLFTCVLSLLDLFWRYESVVVLLKERRVRGTGPLLRLGGHYLLLVLLLARSEVTLLDLLALSLVRGFMTAAVVFANHYPEDRLPAAHRMGLFEQTLRTSRNTTGFFTANSGDSIFRVIFNEATGFLAMQVEHHLVPTWPSGNLMKLRPHVIELAKKHNLPYVETSLVQAWWDNITKLRGDAFSNLKKVQ
jgi:fatty acid desaturase